MSDPTDPVPTSRRFRRGDHDIEIEEGPDHVSLSIDGHPVEVEIVDGRLFSHLAHPILSFDDADALVERMLSNEGSTWRMARRRAPAPHHPPVGPAPEPDPGHDHGDHDHDGPDGGDGS